MAKATTIKEAISRWEKKTNLDPSEATEVNLCFQWPPIEKMDNTLSILSKCEKLSLSTNMIEKIAGINSLKNLKVLSIGRNYLRSFSGLEALQDTLEELWVSYNLIDKVKGATSLRKLRVLYMSNNLVRDWAEIARLQEVPTLEDLLLFGNPIMENMEEAQWRTDVIKKLPNLKKLDGDPVIRDIVE